MNDVLIESLVMQHLALMPNLNRANVKRENINFDPAKITGIWLQVNLRASVSIATSITTDPCVTDYGQIIFQVFDKENNGTGAVKTYANKLAAHFNCKQLFSKDDLLDLQAATTITVGADGNGFYQVNVVIPYQFYSH